MGRRRRLGNRARGTYTSLQQSDSMPETRSIISKPCSLIETVGVSGFQFLLPYLSSSNIVFLLNGHAAVSVNHLVVLGAAGISAWFDGP